MHVPLANLEPFRVSARISDRGWGCVTFEGTGVAAIVSVSLSQPDPKDLVNALRLAADLLERRAAEAAPGRVLTDIEDALLELCAAGGSDLRDEVGTWR